VSETWMISNRQPWPWALINGLISTKTRSPAVHLPPVGATVYLHASKALWRGWRNLWWIQELRLNVTGLRRGGVVGVATVKAVGPTMAVMPARDLEYFQVELGDGKTWSCADQQSIVFQDIRALTFFPCRGAQVPTRRLPFNPAALE